MIAVLLAAALAAAPMPVSQPIEEPELILRVGEGYRALSVEEYVAGVVAAEVPASFHAEALKAQAVAARTYLAYCLANHARDHGGLADLCADASHCAAYTETVPLAIEKAVRDTAGEVLTIDGAPILAMWHASTAGYTAACGEILAEVEYLQPVLSPEKAEITRISFEKSEVVRRLAKLGCSYNRVESVSMSTTVSGRCDRLTLGNVTLTGREVRSCFELRSTDFTVSWEQGHLCFTVFGSGHGIGMSQRGAQVMACEGYTYEEILRHYYSSSKLLLTHS